jgi:hypothetical protein
MFHFAITTILKNKKEVMETVKRAASMKPDW